MEQTEPTYTKFSISDLNRKGTFKRIYAKNLKYRKEQLINFKLDDILIYTFQKTPYYLIKCKESELFLLDHSFEGDCELALPVIAMNKSLELMQTSKWFEENKNKYMRYKFKKKTQNTYKGVSICMS